ncbi:hypothetical protein FRB93_013786 [Tulasnella sp. JGI-2019a]|nr:hypothetical protein FRB93_013786 [Tulasnella sp. JGI-2019a]
MRPAANSSLFSALAPLSPNIIPLYHDIQEMDRREVEQLIERGVDNLAPPPSTTDDNEYSVEYPRHGRQHSPLPFDPYSSFARSQHFDFAPADDRQDYNRYQPSPRHVQKISLSYREDDTYRGGDTMSTANHHRSGITLGAGIRGRMPSLSPRQRGGEYDPDRQIDRLIDQRGQMSMFDDATPQKGNRKGQGARSRPENKSATEIHVQTFASHPTFDPIIVDDTAEIDRAVESGHLQLNNVPALPQPRYQRNRSSDDDVESHPESDISSFRRSDPPTPPARPKLSDALGRVADDRRETAFTPRRQPFSSSPVQSPRMRMAASITNNKPQRQNFPPASQRPTAQEQLSDRSKSEASSKFTKLARGLKPEIEKGRRDEIAWAQSQQRNPFIDEVEPIREDRPVDPTPRRRRVQPSQPQAGPSSQVYLPDVTGITAAMDTPVKSRMSYRTAPSPVKAVNNIFVNAALDELASRLQHVEHENSTARRRVHELELELDQCKEDAKYERTRLEEEKRKRIHLQSPSGDRKGKGRVSDGNMSESGEPNWEMRYHAVLDEKKSLEGLVSTLQTRVSGLTNEVETYRSTIVELREELERDVASIQAKTDEVETLRAEIQRLEEEVGNLRGVVEHSLRARRMNKEAGKGELSAVTEENDGAAEEGHREPQTQSYGRRGVYPPPTQDAAYDTETELGDNNEPYYRQNGEGHQTHIEIHDATIEYTQRSMDPAPLQPRKESQVFQPPAQRTRSGSNGSVIRASSRMSSRAPTPRFGPAAAAARPQSRLSVIRSEGQVQDDDQSSTSSLGQPLSRAAQNYANRDAANQDPDASSDPGTVDHLHQKPTTHINLRTVKLARHHSSPPAVTGSSDEMPFPRLRGERAEKLFFDATKHDERKCRKCRSRRKGKGSRSNEEPYEEEDTGAWLATFLAQKRERNPGDASMPSETMLVHLARELEDEFTHHKSIYIELAEQYALMDAVSNVAKRNILADHLRDVIDILESKGDHIAALYDLLSGSNRHLSNTPPVPNDD